MFELNPTCRCKHLNKLRSTSYISAANAQLGTCDLDICIAEFWFGATMFESLGGPAIVWNLFCCILVFETFFRELSARTLASKLLNWYMFIRVRVGSLSFRINFCIQFHTLCFKAISLFIRSFWNVLLHKLSTHTHYTYIYIYIHTYTHTHTCFLTF